MIIVAYSTAFSTAYEKFIKTQPEKQQLLGEKINLFIEDTFNLKLRTLKLKSILKDFLAFSIDYDLRVIFILLLQLK